RQKERSFLKQFLGKQDLVAYFCAEFGLHESLPIYSGGLGILAGDHCKAASDLAIPFVAVGLLYRQGYFRQQIDAHGQQQELYRTSNLDDLPVTRAVDDGGAPLQVRVALPGRDLHLQVWLAKAGHIQLVLLDSDLPENSEADRDITFRLYGGDHVNRIQQEVVLGIGGVRALRALGLEPNIWHINEGHAAFQVLERCRGHMKKGLDFAAALELTAAATLFTTHTPVPAGHDIFESDLVLEYFGHWLEKFGLTSEEFLNLGRATTELHGFNMTSLALHGSRFHNGVSAIHGDVASRNETAIWPELEPEENPISHITNGVHCSTFISREWQNLFDMRFPDWRNELINDDYWRCIDKIADHRFWSVRRECKAMLARTLRNRLVQHLKRNNRSESEIRIMTQWLGEKGEEALMVGFARRFATYKRALLLFNDIERLGRLLTDNERPILFIFAGKAHPADQPGQELIARIHQHALNPAWAGKILLVEDYDLSLSRTLVAGVDVWLNNPDYPMEACGTSGEKAAINGVLNLSVTDGWWAEGYDGDNGWAIYPHDPGLPHHDRDHAEACALYGLLEQEVVPTFYERGEHGFSRRWVRMAKNSMKTIIPRFSAERMVVDYISQFYSKAAAHERDLAADGASLAIDLAQWKHKIRVSWPSVTIEPLELPDPTVSEEEKIHLSVAAHLAGLNPDDVVVECVTGKLGEDGTFAIDKVHPLAFEEQESKDTAIYATTLTTPLHGLVHYRLRAYPWHQGLAHRFEMGLMRYAIGKG
ncbi:MAG: alpha-glucan family phosphorylase, partial [Pseudomonadota bacterium]|nr:alpha-glucan family phosphorylase [Pseudomonadota bacterium]